MKKSKLKEIIKQTLKEETFQDLDQRLANYQDIDIHEFQGIIEDSMGKFFKDPENQKLKFDFKRWFEKVFVNYLKREFTGKYI